MNVWLIFLLLDFSFGLTASLDNVKEMEEEEILMLVESTLATPHTTETLAIVTAFLRQWEELPSGAVKSIHGNTERLIAQNVFLNGDHSFLKIFSSFIIFDCGFLERHPFSLTFQIQKEMIESPYVKPDLKLALSTYLTHNAHQLSDVSPLIKQTLKSTRFLNLNVQRFDLVLTIYKRENPVDDFVEDLLGVWLHLLDVSVLSEQSADALLDGLLSHTNLPKLIWQHGIKPLGHTSLLDFIFRSEFDVVSLLMWEVPKRLGESPSDYLYQWLGRPEIVSLPGASEVLTNYFEGILTDNSAVIPAHFERICPEVLGLVEWTFIFKRTSDRHLEDLCGFTPFQKAVDLESEIKRRLLNAADNGTSEHLDRMAALIEIGESHMNYVEFALQERPGSPILWLLIEKINRKSPSSRLDAMVRRAMIPADKYEQIICTLLERSCEATVRLISLMHATNPLSAQMLLGLCRCAGHLLAHGWDTLQLVSKMIKTLELADCLKAIEVGYREERSRMHWPIDSYLLNSLPRYLTPRQ